MIKTSGITVEGPKEIVICCYDNAYWIWFS